MVAKLQGLYRADQEHADHSTADDIVRVFYLVTIGVWMLLVASRLVGRTSPSIYALITFWALAICILPMVRTIDASPVPAVPRLRPEHADPGRRARSVS